MAQRNTTSKEILERRNVQIDQLKNVIDHLTKRRNELRENNEQLLLLQSVSVGLYDEMDKLAKKAGADQVTNLALEQINDFIRDAKKLMPEDAYVLRQKEFVAAGDNPEHRDVLVVMRQLRQGLERYEAKLKSAQERCNELPDDAKGVVVAVECFIEWQHEVSKVDLANNNAAVQSRWLTIDDDGDDAIFSFELLDDTDIPTYFSLDK